MVVAATPESCPLVQENHPPLSPSVPPPLLLHDSRSQLSLLLSPLDLRNSSHLSSRAYSNLWGSIREPESRSDLALLRLRTIRTVRSLNWVRCFVQDAAVGLVSVLPSKAVSVAAAVLDATYVLLWVAGHVGLLLGTVAAVVALH